VRIKQLQVEKIDEFVLQLTKKKEGNLRIQIKLKNSKEAAN